MVIPANLERVVHPERPFSRLPTKLRTGARASPSTPSVRDPRRLPRRPPLLLHAAFFPLPPPRILSNALVNDLIRPATSSSLPGVLSDFKFVPPSKADNNSRTANNVFESSRRSPLLPVTPLIFRFPTFIKRLSRITPSWPNKGRSPFGLPDPQSIPSAFEFDWLLDAAVVARRSRVSGTAKTVACLKIYSKIQDSSHGWSRFRNSFFILPKSNYKNSSVQNFVLISIFEISTLNNRCPIGFTDIFTIHLIYLWKLRNFWLLWQILTIFSRS